MASAQGIVGRSGLHAGRFHSGDDGLQAAHALFGFAAVGLLVAILPAGRFALLAELDDDAVAAREYIEVASR